MSSKCAGLMMCLLASVNLEDCSSASTGSGLTQFWPDDYNTFQQVYGKTSDFEIYGDNLPTRVVDNGKSNPNNHRPKHVALPDAAADGSNVSSFQDDIPIPKIERKRKRRTKVKNEFTAEDVERPTPYKSDVDDDTLSYLKQYHQLGVTESINFPQANIGTFKPYAGLPYVNYKAAFGNDPDKYKNYDSYKNIQDIINSQDSYEDGDTIYGKPKDYKQYGSDVIVPFKSKKKFENQSKIKQPIRAAQSNKIGKQIGKCASGLCRKRNIPPQPRYRSGRPRVRKIKQRIVRYVA